MPEFVMTRGRWTMRWLTAALAASAGGAALAGDFADQVVEYFPAPGQFINNPDYNDLSHALGAPVGGGMSNPDNSKLVSLGGLGGSITLRFTPPVMDDPCNPYGLDCIVFGNASFVGGNPSRRFAEAGVIEISRDDNANGLPDDAWYVVPGSHLPPIPADAYQSQAWDNNPTSATPPGNVAWYPQPPWFVNWPSAYITATLHLPPLFEAAVLVNPNGLASTVEGVWGYADCTPTLILGDTDADDTVDSPGVSAGQFYTSPDNPFVVGVSPGSGGGDGFDIAWAVDWLTGQPARLDRFDFLRISTAENYIAGTLGELSTEVGGAARVRARASFYDVNGDGAANAEDLYSWHAPVSPVQADLTGEGTTNAADRAALVRCVRAADAADLGAGR